MKITIERVVIAVLAIILAFSLFKCDGKNKELAQLQFEKQLLDSTVNERGQTILKQEVLITQNKEALNDLTDSIFALTKRQEKQVKDVIAYYKGISNIVIKDKLVPYIDQEAKKKWEDSVTQRCNEVIEYYEANTIAVPKTAQDSTKDYKAVLTAAKEGIHINSIIIPDSQYIRFVTLKGGLFKRNQQGKLKFWLRKSVQVQVLHTNPLIKVTGQNSALYVPPKKPRILEKIILIGGGIYLGSKL